MEENEEDIINEEIEEGEESTAPLNLDEFTHFVGVKFHNGLRTYFFGTNESDLKEGEPVIVETNRGLEVAKCTSNSLPISEYKRNLALKPIIRKATQSDIKTNETNIKDATYALTICENEIKKLGLDMHLIDCEYTLDRSKITFSYLADERVDFRELLKVLASRFHTRIELRQIGARDKAKTVGGLGVCGLPLCCSMFLNEFDGISINRAKNQFLTINIPKLSGQCGKLMCCLKYEDDTYTELKTAFPELGKTITMDKEQYTVSSINVISNMVELRNEENIVTIPLERYNEVIKEQRKGHKHEES